MNRSVLIVLLALIAHLCSAEIVIQTSEPKHLVDLYDAAVDILMTCYGDPGSAVGIVGDSDGSILKALRSKYFIPVVLINHEVIPDDLEASHAHELQVFVVAADSPEKAFDLMHILLVSKWWNQYANFLLVDKTTDSNRQCSEASEYASFPITFGVLNAQFICSHRSTGRWIFNSNLFTRQAAPVWRLVDHIKMRNIKRSINIFKRPYKAGEVCEDLNFPKTINIGGWPVYFITNLHPRLFKVNIRTLRKIFKSSFPDDRSKFLLAMIHSKHWFMNNLVRPMNASIKIFNPSIDSIDESPIEPYGIQLLSNYLSFNTSTAKNVVSRIIFPLSDEALFAVTKYTSHMSQLDKVLSVIDGNCRIGMWVVYFISFLFFKLFLRQAVIPALLNLVRLTCNTGIPNTPQNLAPRIYLACLFMFVITLQGIYTGNLASLLTKTIAYKNVETKEDILKLGYTVYITKNTNAKLAADPMLVGRVIEIPASKQCIEYLLREPLVTCVQSIHESVDLALRENLHVSRDPILREYPYYPITQKNPLGRRFGSIMRRWNEHGIYQTDPIFEKLRLQLIDDDEVKKNTARRVMTLSDLGFAFVILGIGLLCSSICFIGEIVICKIRLKIEQRRNQVHVWGVNENSLSLFPSLNFRFNVRGLFSNRR